MSKSLSRWSRVALVLVALLIPKPAWSQERIIGLLEIPELHGSVNSGNAEKASGPIVLRQEPGATSPVLFTVTDRHQLESREHDYEQVSATLYKLAQTEGEGVWYKVRFETPQQSGFGWFTPGQTAEPRLLYPLITSHLAYLTKDWDGRIFEAPGDGPAAAVATTPGEQQGVQLIGSRDLGGETWYHITLVQGECSGEPLKVKATGWVPAYSGEGLTTVWYYSRGC